MHTGMSDHNRSAVSDALSKLLADTYALYLKTQNFHWNVTGPQFFSLHILFEKQYTELSEAIDEIAERIRALGFFVDASFAAFKNLTGIPESDKVLTAEDMLKELVKGHEALIKEQRRISDIADKEHDPATGDLMARRLVVHEKFAWMLRSQL